MNAAQLVGFGLFVGAARIRAGLGRFRPCEIILRRLRRAEVVKKTSSAASRRNSVAQLAFLFVAESRILRVDFQAFLPLRRNFLLFAELPIVGVVDLDSLQPLFVHLRALGVIKPVEITLSLHCIGLGIMRPPTVVKRRQHVSGRVYQPQRRIEIVLLLLIQLVDFSLVKMQRRRGLVDPEPRRLDRARIPKVLFCRLGNLRVVILHSLIDIQHVMPKRLSPADQCFEDMTADLDRAHRDQSGTDAANRPAQ